MPTNLKKIHVGRKVVDIVFGEGAVRRFKSGPHRDHIEVIFHAGTEDEHIQKYDGEGRLLSGFKVKRSLFLPGETPEDYFIRTFDDYTAAIGRHHKVFNLLHALRQPEVDRIIDLPQKELQAEYEAKEDEILAMNIERNKASLKEEEGS